MSTLDHVTLFVSDYARSKAFYENALAPLGIGPLMEFGQACGFGRRAKPEFWIGIMGHSCSIQTDTTLRPSSTELRRASRRD
jgi:catechol 2,3-dioxygenase-like lactoylglutathione lyase family enzyme